MLDFTQVSIDSGSVSPDRCAARVRPDLAVQKFASAFHKDYFAASAVA